MTCGFAGDIARSGFSDVIDAVPGSESQKEGEREEVDQGLWIPASKLQRAAV